MPGDPFRQALEEISGEYRAALPQKLDALEAQWKAAGDEPPEALRRAFHSLAGSAKTFGLAAVSDAARAAETFLDGYCERGTALDAKGRAGLEQLLDALKRAAFASTAK